MTSAVQQLSPSRLSDQLETFNSDVDLAALNLAVQDKASFPLLERVTTATIERTIEGASTLTIVADDDDRRILNSGYLPAQGKGFIGYGLDTEIDGLWFRLLSWAKNGDDLTLTFIDREVALLKQWPPTSEGVNMYRVWPADKFGLATRFHFAKSLIDDVNNAYGVAIRFDCPDLGDANLSGDAPSPNPGHGFPTNNDIEVKTRKATPQQLAELDTVLTVGDELGARRKVLICAIVVVTQESDAGADVGNDPNAVGDFQQNPADGWPATGNTSADANGFFQKAIAHDKEFPNVTIGELAQMVQRSGYPNAYGQWEDQATYTVDVWLGNTDPTTPAAAVQVTNAPDPTRGQFMRGRLETPTAAARKHKQIVVATAAGNKVVVREDNWTCLTRLASEIGYRCFMVSGTCTFASDYQLFHRKVAMTLREGEDGVDTIDPDFTQGRQNGQLTVAARAGRWKVPPGRVAAVKDVGPASGRWLMVSSLRSLFDTDTTITLKKPVEAIPESAAPEHGSGQTSGTVIYKPSGAPPGGSEDQKLMQRGQVAEKLLKQYQRGWFDDNGKGLEQIQETQGGAKLDGAEGPVYLDTRTMQVILWLISQGFIIGTFAWCTDHSDDGIRGHAGGHAVDISSINGVPINRFDARDLTLKVATLLHNLSGELAPRQLICGGYGGIRDAEISAQSIPAADSFYGTQTMQEHTNHIHVGY